jgi:hypothetical protein
VGLTEEWGQCCCYYREGVEWEGIGSGEYHSHYILYLHYASAEKCWRSVGDEESAKKRTMANHMQPPQSFQPPLPVPSSATNASPAQPKSLQPDLITRYNLKSKIEEEASRPITPIVEEEKKQGNAWSANKGERQALLQRRREEMILQARRKMEARVKAESAAGVTQGSES